MHTFDLHDFCAGLIALAESAFPKRCRNCGRVYASSTEFVEATQPVTSHKYKSGLKASLDDDGTVIIELFRNCVCGSTLMDTFNDRRDVSKAGIHRRKRFSEMQAYLVGQGIEPSVATGELRKVLRGQASELLRNIALPGAGLTRLATPPD